MTRFQLRLPPYFDDYAAEIEAKGYFADVIVEADGRQYRPVFYDPARLAQEIRDELDREGVFAEDDLVIVDAVTRETIEAAVAKLAGKGFRTLKATTNL
ncbi:MAG TPA: hypothetical protein VF526_10535 [Solirubrobacteraceae bacterium]|jgi:hypothetical protein